jgi:signal transduction histidine kinase
MGSEEGRPRESRREAARALLSILARALHLERAVLLLERAPDDVLVTVAVHGDVTLRTVEPGTEPGDGPWSAALPVRMADREPGLLLVARHDGSPLPAEDLELAERLCEGAAEFLEQQSARDDLDQARTLLARADRLSALGTLAAGIAHEIRNPLVSVRTFIQLLPERLDDAEFRTSFRELALTEIERIAELTNDLLAFSRAHSADEARSDLNLLVAQTLRLLDSEARKRDITVDCDLTPSLPPVGVGDGQVKQVLLNVVLNGLQASPSHGRLLVRTTSGARGCEVEVADAGPGIPPERVERIFDAFFTTKDSGSGLGLFIAQQIVRERGGRISVRPRAGGGTIFAILFPHAPLENGEEDAYG